MVLQGRFLLQGRTQGEPVIGEFLVSFVIFWRNFPSPSSSSLSSLRLILLLPLFLMNRLSPLLCPLVHLFFPKPLLCISSSLRFELVLFD